MPELKPVQAVTCDLGRDDLAKYLGGLGGGKLSYFKFGEGGWSPSAAFTEQIGLGIGGPTVTAQSNRYPVVAGTMTVTAGSQKAYDNGSGGFYGSDVVSGTIDYRTGAISITFVVNVAGGEPISGTYRTWGGESGWVEDDWEEGDGTTGPYSGTLACVPIIPGTVSVWDSGTQHLVDDGLGNLVDEAPGGTGTGTVNYVTGAIQVTFESVVSLGNPIRATYRYYRKPKQPVRGHTDIEATGMGLFSIQKSLVPADFVFQGSGTGRVRITCSLSASEGNDDGSGHSPVYSEAGIYTSEDVLVIYVTWPGVKKTSAAALSRVIDLVV